MTRPTVHASAAFVGGRGVLIRGRPGVGKSSLLLQLLSSDDGATRLVADDRVVLRGEGGRVMGSPPDTLAGLIEVRGQGILRLPYIAPVSIDLVVDLAPVAECPRMPAADERFVILAGIRVARIFIAAGVPDGSARVRAALRWPVAESA